MAERPQALILAPFSGEALADLKHSVNVFYESWTETKKLYDPEQLGHRLQKAGIPIVVIESDFVFEETFDASPNLKFVGICRTTTSHVDLDAATRKGVFVVNTPGRNSQAVAEHVLGLMLSLARRIPDAHVYTKWGHWDDPTEPYSKFRGVELSGRVLGIVGLGAIGQSLAQMVVGFPMTVCAYDPYLTKAPEGVQLISLEELLSSSDFIVTLAPSTPDTSELLNARRINLIRTSAYLITASGISIAEQDALFDALRNDHIAGAAIDVFETHPIAPDNPLLSLDNVILTPHIGGATEETIQRHSRIMVGDILRFISGKRPINLVNPDVWKTHD
jgi:D-3-phosphoglycerate dehydrogenase